MTPQAAAYCICTCIASAAFASLIGETILLLLLLDLALSVLSVSVARGPMNPSNFHAFLSACFNIPTAAAAESVCLAASAHPDTIQHCQVEGGHTTGSISEGLEWLQHRQRCVGFVCSAVQVQDLEDAHLEGKGRGSKDGFEFSAGVKFC